MQIRWHEEAVSDLQQLQEYIAQDKPKAAQEIGKHILKAVNLLSKQPYIGRPGRVPNTRELVVSGTPYFLPYQVRNGIIEVLRVLHSAMRWPHKL